MVEHLKYAGQSMVIWLMKITNSIIDLEMIPDFMKVGCL
jgi:hypothetical protein